MKKMKTHDLKISPQYFKQIKSGLKAWDLRYNDRNYRIGDKVILREWEEGYTGRKVSRLIVNKIGSIQGLNRGWVILSLGLLIRASRQNNYYWSQMERLSVVIPEAERTSLGWHELLKSQILGIKDIHLNGEEIPFSTAWLSVEQYNWYLRQANDWVLRRYGVEFEDSEIYKYNQWREYEGKVRAQS